jgi:putative ABC transport system permease protein
LGSRSRGAIRILVAGSEDIPTAENELNLKEFQSWAQSYIKDNNLRGVSVENLENGQPLSKKTIDQANRFLSLVALLTGMIAAVGISLASRRYAKKQVTQTVVKKCFGASGLQILKSHIYVFLQIMLIASVIGLTCGYLLQEVLVNILQNLIDKAFAKSKCMANRVGIFGRVYFITRV